MSHTYCIYFGDSPFYITSALTPKLKEFADRKDAIILQNPLSIALGNAVLQMQQNLLKAVVVITQNVQDYWQQFSELFLVIRAAGGLVVNEKGEYLFIFRRGKWDLPKGKLDEGETLESCAVREVQEETGLSYVSIVTPLGQTWHVYFERGNWVLKESFWYKMKANSQEILVPQLEEDITQITWLSPEDVSKVLGHSYPSVEEVLSRMATV